ncbi:hypothetical protein CUMW_235900 [Citrus unshiu]|uniref:Uncharacterized protein n=1 Tax=Citrus unshiu TaxID=55188 RepID=A0A2H5QJF6_CITUN|nr:hypothetical protein CUMW_235900 [Citrus unshiu]
MALSFNGSRCILALESYCLNCKRPGTDNSCYDEERFTRTLWIRNGSCGKEGKASELMEAALDGPCPENELLEMHSC